MTTRSVLFTPLSVVRFCRTGKGVSQKLLTEFDVRAQKRGAVWCSIIGPSPGKWARKGISEIRRPAPDICVPQIAAGAVMAHLLRLVACALLLSSCSGLAREPSNNDLVEDFLQVLTVRRSVQGIHDRNEIRKWERPILWATLGKVDGDALKFLEDTLDQYGRVVGQDFRSAQAGETANYVIAFVPSAPPESVLEYVKTQRSEVGLHESIRSRISSGSDLKYLQWRYNTSNGPPGYQKTYCMFFNMATEGYGLAYIASDYFMLRRCMAEETLQMLGLQFDSIKSWPSIMSVNAAGYSTDALERASIYDLLYLRILYDTRLRSGMTRDEARPIALQVISEIRPDETRPPEFTRLIRP